METSTPVRVPPHSEEAEQSVLGSILLDPKLIRQCIKKDLTPGHFYIPAHQNVFKTMLDLSAKGKPTDIRLIADKLKESGHLNGIGGATFLDRLIDHTPTTAYLTHYMDIVFKKYKRRQVIQFARQTEIQAQESDDDEDILLSKVKFDFSKIGFSRNGQKTIPEAVAKLIASYQEARKTGVSTGVPSRYFDLQQKIIGYKPRQKTIIAGAPSAGKTTLGLNEILHSAIIGQPALIVSIEMEYEEIVARLIADLTGIDFTDYMKGNVSYEDIKRFQQGGEVLAKLPLYIVDGNTTMEKYDAVVREHVEEYGVVLTMLDYIQIADPPPGKKFANRNLELTYMSKVTMNLSNDTRVSQLIISQLSRGWCPVGKERKTEPQLNHLRDSGSLEQDADVVLMLFPHPDTMGDEWEDNEPTICKIAKQRNGKRGKIDLTFNKIHNRFIGTDKETIPIDLLEAWEGKEVDPF